MSEVSKILIVIALSSVKFVGGPALAYHYHFSFVEILLYTICGGMAGVVIISYFSPWIVVGWEWFRNLFRKKENHIYAEPTLDIKGKVRIKYSYLSLHPKKKRVLFTPFNRRVIRLWRKYGLIGIAILTPVIFSIPLGTFVATRLANDRDKVFLYMFISLVCWSLVITSILFRVINVPSEMITQ